MKSGGEKLIRGFYDQRIGFSAVGEGGGLSAVGIELLKQHDTLAIPPRHETLRTANETMHRTAATGSAFMTMADSAIPTRHDKIKYSPIHSLAALFVTNAAILTTRGMPFVTNRAALRTVENGVRTGSDGGRRPRSGCDAIGGCHQITPYAFLAGAAAALRLMSCRVAAMGAAAVFFLTPASALNPYGIQEGQEI